MAKYSPKWQLALGKDGTVGVTATQVEKQNGGSEAKSVIRVERSEFILVANVGGHDEGSEYSSRCGPRIVSCEENCRPKVRQLLPMRQDQPFLQG